jgi:hypothetical protein
MRHLIEGVVRLASLLTVAGAVWITAGCSGGNDADATSDGTAGTVTGAGAGAIAGGGGCIVQCAVIIHALM